MRRPGPWLSVLALLLMLAILDASRAPDKQITARLYLGAVRFYQHDIHPFSSRYIRCRYNPTCSRYSIEAVQRFGILKGAWLTARRVVSCNGSVPMGTSDPVPSR